MTSDATTRRVFGLEWPAQVTTAERRSLIAGGLGWMLDAMDVMLYSMVLAELVVSLGMSKPQAGLLNSLTKFGRRKSYVFYLVMAAILVPVFGMTRSLTTLLILGPLAGFFGTGYFSGFAAIASELFPTEIRASVMGLTYNIGRGFSAIAPFVVGAIAKEHSFFAAFLLLPPPS